MRNLLGRLLVRNRGFLLATSLVLGWFQFLLCALVAEIDLQGALEQVLAFTPPVMRAVVEQAMLGGTAQGVLAFGWDHPIAHAVCAAVAIALAARAVAGEVESGVIELVLAQPLRRAVYLWAHLLFGLGASALVSAAGAIGTVAGQQVFGLRLFGIDRVAALALNLVLLQAAIYGATLLASAWGREAGRAAVTGVLLTVACYFIDVFATLWPRAAFLEPYSIYSYYDPRAILVRDQLAASHLLVLAACCALTTTLAFLRFGRRDLP